MYRRTLLSVYIFLACFCLVSLGFFMAVVVGGWGVGGDFFYSVLFFVFWIFWVGVGGGGGPQVIINSKTYIDTISSSMSNQWSACMQ